MTRQNYRISCVMSLAVLGLAGIGLGQDPVPAPVPQAEGTKATEAESSQRDGPRTWNEAFQKESPQVGELVPDVAVYDADGHKLRLREVMNGHYSVLVFGCLT